MSRKHGLGGGAVHFVTSDAPATLRAEKPRTVHMADKEYPPLPPVPVRLVTAEHPAATIRRLRSGCLVALSYLPEDHPAAIALRQGLEGA